MTDGFSLPMLSLPPEINLFIIPSDPPHWELYWELFYSWVWASLGRKQLWSEILFHPPKIGGYFCGIAAVHSRDIYKEHILLKKMDVKSETRPQQWPKQFAPLYVRPEPPPR